MKTRQWKIATVALLATMALSGTCLAGGPISGAPVLNVEKSAISNDLVQIKTARERMKYLKGEIKDERSRKEGTVATHKNLVKAKADYVQAKTYLRADKKDMLKDHQAYIRERRSALTADYVAMIQTKFDLVNSDKQWSEKQPIIAARKQQIKDDRGALHSAIISRNNDLIMANVKIEKAKGQSIALLKIQDKSAELQSLAMK